MVAFPVHISPPTLPGAKLAFTGPILTELYSISYILPDHFEAFQTLDPASFFRCIISNLDFRLLVLPWFGP